MRNNHDTEKATPAARLAPEATPLPQGSAGVALCVSSSHREKQKC